MKPVKCRFKNLSIEMKELIKKSTPLILISVGQEAHEGEKLKATIDLLNRSASACIISLYDSLQRHTMSLNSKEDPAYFQEHATLEGELWLKRNQKYLDQLAIPYQVYRWNQWLNHPDYPAYHHQLLHALKTDMHYRSEFQLAIDSYLERYTKNISHRENFDLKRAQEICYHYILEECTVLCLWAELQCNFEVYPSKHNAAIEATRVKFIPQDNDNRLLPLTLRFTNAKQPRSQRFMSLGMEMPAVAHYISR